MAKYTCKIANTREELNRLINDKWTVISIRGEAYELLSDKIYEIGKKKYKSHKNVKRSAIFTGIAGLATVIAPGFNLMVIALIATLIGGGAIGVSKLNLGLLTQKEYRKFLNYSVEEINEDAKEIIITHKRYDLADEYTFEQV